MTPHTSGITTDTFAGRADDIAANIGRLARGEPLRSVVAPGWQPTAPGFVQCGVR
jgi:phosphoglycerate dehydrogenase-like enzyme